MQSQGNEIDVLNEVLIPWSLEKTATRSSVLDDLLKAENTIITVITGTCTATKWLSYLCTVGFRNAIEDSVDSID